MRQSRLLAMRASRSSQRWKPGSNSALDGTTTCILRSVFRGCTKRVSTICRFNPLYRLCMKSPQNLGFISVWTCIPMIISDALNSRNACLMPLAIFVARRTCVCILTSTDVARCCKVSSSRRPCSRCFAALLSSYTTLSATNSRFSCWLRTMMANSNSWGAISGYLTQSSIFSSSSCWDLAVSCSLLERIICWAAFSVIMVEMMQVMSIMMTTPFSISLFTR